MVAKPLISIVDDDEGVRSSLDGLIRSMGYSVAAFGSAESFLASEAHEACRCVISDVQMPGGMSGIELARLVRSEGTSTPVILISAFVNDETLIAARNVGAYCTLRKPFDGEALVSCVERALAS